MKPCALGTASPLARRTDTFRKVHKAVAGIDLTDKQVSFRYDSAAYPIDASAE
jgi:hypothetical protein